MNKKIITNNNILQNHKDNKKRKRKLWKIIITLVLVVILGICASVGWAAYKAMKNTNSNNTVLDLLKNNQELKGQAEGRTNILIMGIGGSDHPGGTLSDSMEIFSIDWTNNKLAMLAIPRDLYVKIPDYGYYKINNANALGQQKDKKNGGGELASKTVSEVLGIPIQYYVTIDFTGFKEIIDTVGGIDINVEKAINDPYYPAADMIHYDPFKISAGLHHMDGALALKYARSRETTSDFDRAKRQQQVFTALKDKIVSLNTLANPAKITELINSIGNHLTTNLNVAEIKSLWDEINKIDTANIINKSLDNSSDGLLIDSTTKDGGYILIPKKGMGNYQDIQNLEKDIFVSPSPTPTQSVKATSKTK